MARGRPAPVVRPAAGDSRARGSQWAERPRPEGSACAGAHMRVPLRLTVLCAAALAAAASAAGEASGAVPTATETYNASTPSVVPDAGVADASAQSTPSVIASTASTARTEMLVAAPTASILPAEMQPADVQAELKMAAVKQAVETPKEEFKLEDTPFVDWLDAAAWTQYVCGQLLRAGATDALETCLSRLQTIAGRLEEDDGHALRDAYWRLATVRDAHMRNQKQGQSQYGSAGDAPEIVSHLLNGQYVKAKDMVKKRLDAGDYAGFDAGLKAAVAAVGLVQWDGMAPGAIVPLWAPDWALSADEKIAALVRARQLFRRAQIAAGTPGAPDPQLADAFRPFSRLPLVDARVLALLGRDATALFGAAWLRDDAAERDIVRAQMAETQGESCIARDLLASASRMAASAVVADELRGAAKRLGERCERAQAAGTYRAFCQTDAAFPLADAARADGLPGDVTAAVSTEERMFWTRLAAGDCELAGHALREVRRVLPVSVVAARSYLDVRLRHMDSALSSCVRAPGLYVNTFGHRLMDALRREAYPEALSLWRDNFAYSPGSAAALRWRRAILVSRFPKATYAPCMGNALLSPGGDTDADRELLARLATIMAGEPVPPCNSPDAAVRDACVLGWMRAFYVADDAKKVAEYGARLPPGPGQDEALALRACAKLCLPGCGGPRDACRAAEAYGRMSADGKALPHVRIGFGLARQTCDAAGKRETAPSLFTDAFYVRDGALPRPVGALFRAYLPADLKRAGSAIVPRAAFVHEKGAAGCADLLVEPGTKGGARFRLPFTPHGQSAPLVSRADTVHTAFERFLAAVHPRKKDPYAEVVAAATPRKAPEALEAPTIAELVRRYPFLAEFFPADAKKDIPAAARALLAQKLAAKASDVEQHVVNSLVAPAPSA